MVEDQELFRDMMCEVLGQNGYKILVAKDGNEALEICHRHSDSIDLVISDVIMPQMSGTQLSEKLALCYPGVKMLFMSGYTEDAMVNHGLLPEPKELLQKPFTAENLLQRVRTVLAGARAA